MSPASRGTTTSMDPAFGAVLLGAMALVMVGSADVWAGAKLAYLTAGAAVPPRNPFKLVIDLARGRFAWSKVASVWAIALGAVVVLVVVGITAVVAHHLSRRVVIDRRARLLPRNKRSLRRYTDLGSGPSSEVPGRPRIGLVVSGPNRVVRATWEDVVVWIAGARMGKTTSMVCPAICHAPGAVYATSNKADIVTITRDYRSNQGTVWLFDPQGLAGADTEPGFWWNPLDVAKSVAGARMLAGLLAAAKATQGSTHDAYFAPEGEELLAMCLLAAATACLPITAVYQWLSEAKDEQAAEILHEAGFDLAATGVSGRFELPDRQRAGVFATAAKTMAFLADPMIARWVTDPGNGRARFDAARFVRTTETFYSLSKEGPGTAGALTGALTAAVLDEAERYAATKGGRLPVPLVCALDEVANVCRWRDLPDLYSHYGSRGIILMSFLQSWSQGVQAWGEQGMAKLWGAANIRVYGGGVSEPGFLNNVSAVCGQVDVRQPSSTWSAGSGRSVSNMTRKEAVFDTGTLAALPLGRAVVMLSGAYPVLVRTEPLKLPTRGAPASPPMGSGSSIAQADPTGSPTPAPSPGAGGSSEPTPADLGRKSPALP